MGGLICFKHGVPMPVFHEGSEEPFKAALHRCQICTAEFRAAFAKAARKRARRQHNLRQRVLPPVVMSERWP